MSLPVVVITGASAGIGEYLALEISKTHAYRQVIVARRKAELEAVAQKCGGGENTLAIVADVTIKAEAERVIAETIQAFGTVDILVNNVGRGCWSKPSELTSEVITDMINVNVNSALFCTQAVLPIFQEKKQGQAIFINSLAGRIPSMALRSAYIGSKHFLIGLVGSFRAEFAQDYPNIKFQTFSPGPVATDFGLIASGGVQDSRSFEGAQDVQEVAVAILELSIRKKQEEAYSREEYKDKIRSALAKATAD